MSTSVYVSLGVPFQIFDTPFSGDVFLGKLVLGGEIEMPDDLAKSAIVSGAAIVPKAIFDAVDFSPAEVKSHPISKTHAGAPAEFLEKYKAALTALHEHRAQLAQ